MAKTTYTLIPEGLDLKYKKTLQSGDRFQFARVRRKLLFTSRRRKKGLTEKSLLPILSPVWNALDNSVRDLWTEVGALNNMSGFKLFLKDTALRLKNDIAGYASPSLLHQGAVGRLHVEAPATSIKIAQLHPYKYWVLRKVTGSRDQYSPVEVVESFALPLEIKCSYKSALTSTGEGARARLWAEVVFSYQGRDITRVLSVDFDLEHDWESKTASITSGLGWVRGYTAYIEIYNARGDLWVDNIEFNHSGQNWCRDTFCNDINQSFTKAFYQVPKHWNDVDVPEGAQFESAYPDD